MMNDNTVRTIADIARLAGVSKSTVSRALSGSPLISVETRERIQKIAQEHQFQINLPARRLSMKQSFTLGFVMHGHEKHLGVNDLFSLELMSSISSATGTFGYDLLMLHIDRTDTTWPGEYLNTGRVDGFILVTSTRKQRQVQTLLKAKAPFIGWGLPSSVEKYCTVIGDNISGGRQAVEHLAERGCKRIAFLGGPGHDASMACGESVDVCEEDEVELRYQGYCEGLAAAGLELDQRRVVYGDYTSESGVSKTIELLERDPDLDAIFANSDMMAIAAVNTLRKNGRRVPEDVRVVGYDDITIAALNYPALTTIRQNIPEIGRMMVRNLIQYLETGEITNSTIPVELVVRETT